MYCTVKYKNSLILKKPSLSQHSNLHKIWQWHPYTLQMVMGGANERPIWQVQWIQRHKHASSIGKFGTSGQQL